MNPYKILLMLSPLTDNPRDLMHCESPFASIVRQTRKTCTTTFHTELNVAMGSLSGLYTAPLTTSVNRRFLRISS